MIIAPEHFHAFPSPEQPLPAENASLPRHQRGYLRELAPVSDEDAEEALRILDGPAFSFNDLYELVQRKSYLVDQSTETDAPATSSTTGTPRVSETPVDQRSPALSSQLAPSLSAMPLDQRETHVVNNRIASLLRIKLLMAVKRDDLLNKVRSAPLVREQGEYRFPGHLSVDQVITGQAPLGPILEAIKLSRETSADVLAEANRNGDLQANRQGGEMSWPSLIEEMADKDLGELILNAQATFMPPTTAMERILRSRTNEPMANLTRLLQPHRVRQQEAMALFRSQLSRGMNTQDGIRFSLVEEKHPTRNKDAWRFRAVTPPEFDMHNLLRGNEYDQALNMIKMQQDQNQRAKAKNA